MCRLQLSPKENTDDDRVEARTFASISPSNESANFYGIHSGDQETERLSAGDPAADPTQDTPSKSGNLEQELAKLQREWSEILKVNYSINNRKAAPTGFLFIWKDCAWSLHMFGRAAMSVATAIEGMSFISPF